MVPGPGISWHSRVGAKCGRRRTEPTTKHTETVRSVKHGVALILPVAAVGAGVARAPDSPLRRR
jgi:hypothetical protein